MGYSLRIAIRYLGATAKGAFVSIGTMLAILGITLGVAALLTVMSVTGGFQSEFRKKILGVNAHVLVLKHGNFREYRDVMDIVRKTPGVTGVAPFSINPMMVAHKDKAATGILVKGVDPELMPTVLDLPEQIKMGSLEGLRKPGTKPAELTPRGGGIPSFPSPALSASPTGSSAPRLLEVLERETERTPPADDPSLNLGSIDDILAVEKGAAKADPKPVSTDAGTSETPEDDAGVGLVGAVEPDGGYGSELPDPMEELPPEISPDPCNSKDAVAQLPGIVVGATLAENLGISLGNCVMVTSPTIGYAYGEGGVIRPPVARQFKVIAIFEAGFDQYDSKLVYVDLYEAQRFNDYGDTVTGVEARVANIDKAGKIRDKVTAELKSGMYYTMDWEDLNRGLFTALSIQKIIMSAVLTVIIAVAALTVIATLIMVVLEKKREIAVLKAMGAKDFSILMIFVYQGGIIGGIGTATGLLLGLGLCKGLLTYGFKLDPTVYFVSRLPIEINGFHVFLTAFVALGICLVATILPALYAAGLRPADGVRPD